MLLPRTAIFRGHSIPRENGGRGPSRASGRTRRRKSRAGRRSAWKQDRRRFRGSGHFPRPACQHTPAPPARPPARTNQRRQLQLGDQPPPCTAMPCGHSTLRVLLALDGASALCGSPLRARPVLCLCGRAVPRPRRLASVAGEGASRARHRGGAAGRVAGVATELGVLGAPMRGWRS